MRMREKKHGLAMILILVMVIVNSFSVCASETNMEAIYDLQKGGTQTFLIESKDGEIDEIIIEEVVGQAKIDAGTYKVVCKTSAWTAGFYVIIMDDKIQAAHSPFYSTTTGEIVSGFLIRNSNLQATYAFVYQVKPLNVNTGVIATISDAQLKVSKI